MKPLLTAILLMLTSTPTATERPPSIYYTDQQIQCLATNIYHEARGEGYLGGLAVAVVTINRTQHVDYPRDICAVVYQSRQFSWTNNPTRAKTTPGTVYLAKLALSGAHELRGFRATHYHHQDIRPMWRLRLKREANIGQHIFYSI